MTNRERYDRAVLAYAEISMRVNDVERKLSKRELHEDAVPPELLDEYLAGEAEIVEGMTAATHGLLDYLRKQLTFNVAMRKKIKNIKHDDTDNDGDQ